MMANRFDEMALLKAGYGFEQTIQLDKKFPDL